MEQKPRATVLLWQHLIDQGKQVWLLRYVEDMTAVCFNRLLSQESEFILETVQTFLKQFCVILE